MKTSAVAELERRYKELENDIAEALLHTSTDDLMVAELTRRKLHIRDEIEELRDKTEDERT
jgi:hypothetical protein